MQTGIVKTENLFNLLLEAVDTKSEAPFFIYNGTRFSYGDSLLVIRKMAGFLRRKGLRRGDCVILSLDNIPEFVYCYFAIAQLGAVSVLVNPVAKRYELRYYIEETKAKLVITSTEQLENYKIDSAFFYEPDRFVLVDQDEREGALLRSIATEEPYVRHESVEPGECASIIFTAAMDGFPLGAMLTHGSIAAVASLLGRGFTTGDDTMLTILPMFHSYGLVGSVMAPLAEQFPFYLISKTTQDQLVPALVRGEITVVNGIPRIFRTFNKKLPEGTTFPGVRIWISGGEYMSPKLITDMRDRFSIDVRQGYGLTEASSIVTWNQFLLENRIGSIGPAMPWNEVRIAGNDGTPMAPGEEGEIVVRGANVMAGYLHSREKTEETIVDGWLHTGDRGTMDSEGYVYITGRIRNMVIRNGLNIYPKEVERILWYHPRVKEVKVIGKRTRVDESTYKESLEATVYLHEGASLDHQTLLNWCLKNISSYKVPDEIIIRG